MSFRIQELRSYLGLSQSQFAREIGKSVAYISKIEHGTLTPSQKAINTICLAFDINESWLRGEGEEIFKAGKGKSAIESEHLKDRVRLIRKELKMTQSDLANELGCSKDQVFSVESGRIHPSREWLLRLSAHFRINEQWLFTGSGNMWEKDAGSVSDEQILLYLKNNKKARKILEEIILHNDITIWNHIQTTVEDNCE